MVIYNDIDSSFATMFVIGYVMFILTYSLGLIVMILVNLKYYKPNQLMKRLLTFFVWFILLSATGQLFNYVFGTKAINLYDIGVPLGVSMGIAFSDLMFIRLKK
ncbi:hypothetical protein [Pseudalkalibacillus berkeleyi]|uniref:YesK-like protein n=1 Tax=Pseudalkalibacillus berkeleyi TaxID=1069813 RepID=A0ABS9H354_9BACL|nr:hypothetical protein [Pseudalkalibacillus berkeleyi]MCF6138277.1 hypothetical protein [Pseudalkalibacillus berkeleyi]